MDAFDVFTLNQWNTFVDSFFLSSHFDQVGKLFVQIGGKREEAVQVDERCRRTGRTRHGGSVPADWTIISQQVRCRLMSGHSFNYHSYVTTRRYWASPSTVMPTLIGLIWQKTTTTVLDGVDAIVISLYILPHCFKLVMWCCSSCHCAPR